MICAIVLAAGRSVRMGTQKLLLPIGGRPLIVHVVDEVTHSPVQQVQVVTGSDGAKIREALREQIVSFVENPDPTGDMLSSVRCGLRSLPKPCKAALIVLGDQPGITRELISRLTEAHLQNADGITAPEFNGKGGHPLLVASHFFNEALEKHDGVGLQGLLISHPEAVQRIPVGTPAALEDMDSPEDYQRLMRLKL